MWPEREIPGMISFAVTYARQEHEIVDTIIGPPGQQSTDDWHWTLNAPVGAAWM